MEREFGKTADFKLPLIVRGNDFFLPQTSFYYLTKGCSMEFLC